MLRHIVDPFRLIAMNRGAGLSRPIFWGCFTVSVLADLAARGCAFGVGITTRDLPRLTMRLGRGI